MRERRFLMWSVLLLLLLSVVLTGCDTVLGLVFKPDLTVTSVDPLMGDTGELTGVRLVFENWGIVSADPATYAVVMSADEVVSLAADTTVYEGTITLAANEEKQIDLTGDDIMAWIESHYDNLELTAPSYFLGAVVDVNNDVEESDELNNEMSSNTSFEMGGTGGGGGGGSIITVDLTDTTPIGDVDGYDFVYYVLAQGSPRDMLTSVYGVGSAVISGGVAAATAEVVDESATLATSGETWYGNVGENYDVYPFIDMNANRMFDQYVDWDLTSTPLTVPMDADGESRTVDRADFSRDPLPATFGVYAELRDVPIVPELSADGVAIDSSYTSGTSYEGSVELEANFTTNSTREIAFNYPIDLDLNASSFIVFAIDDTDAIANGLVSFWLELSGAWTPINVASPGSLRTETGVGPGGRWDIYKVPIANGVWGGLDLSAIRNVSIRATSTGTDPGVDPACACTLYFDDIHFE